MLLYGAHDERCNRLGGVRVAGQVMEDAGTFGATHIECLRDLLTKIGERFLVGREGRSNPDRARGSSFRAEAELQAVDVLLVIRGGARNMHEQRGGGASDGAPVVRAQRAQPEVQPRSASKLGRVRQLASLEEVER